MSTSHSQPLPQPKTNEINTFLFDGLGNRYFVPAGAALVVHAGSGIMPVPSDYIPKQNFYSGTVAPSNFAENGFFAQQDLLNKSSNWDGTQKAASMDSITEAATPLSVAST